MRVTNSMVTSLAAIGLAASLGAQQPGRDPAPMRVPMPEGENCISTDGKMECTKLRMFGPDSASPSGGRDGAYRTYIIGPDGDLTLEPGDKKATEAPKKKK